jgi:hypothetical protein
MADRALDPSLLPPVKPPFSGADLPPPAISPNRSALPRWECRFFPRLEREEDHPKGWTFPEFLDARRPWVGALREMYASPFAFPASISPQVGLLLFSLVRNIRPRTVVEVGSFIGVSTAWIAAALEETAADPPSGGGPGPGLVHSFDDFGPMPPGPWRETDLPMSRLPIVRGYLERAGLAGRVVLHPGDSSVEIVKAATTLRGTLSTATPWGTPVAGPHAGVAGKGGVDFALLDGNHGVQGVLQDLWAVEPVLNTGGYVLLHDTFPEQCGEHAGPRHVIDHITSVAAGEYELCELYTAPLNYGMALLRRLG